MAMQCHRGDHSDKVIFPSSFVKAPLTPPPTDLVATEPVLKIFRLIQECKGGRLGLEPEWHTFKLNHGEYQLLLSLFNTEESLWTFVETKLRYDYDSSIETLVLRMTSYLHEVFLSRVVQEILSKLRAFGNTESPSRAFAENIKHNGSPSLVLRSEGNHGGAIISRSPDATFRHQDAHWPGVIIEVSYSQKTRAIPHLADEYILETDGSVRVVVGLDIDYKTKKGTASMWRPHYIRNEQGQLELEAAQTLNNLVFRDEFGNSNLSRDNGLKLELADFAPEDLARGITGSISIDSATLCRFLDEAEQMDQKAKQKQGAVQHLVPGAKKRRREKTPTEDINSDDERRYTDIEQRVQERELADDSPYHSSQS